MLLTTTLFSLENMFSLAIWSIPVMTPSWTWSLLLKADDRNPERNARISLWWGLSRSYVIGASYSSTSMTVLRPLETWRILLRS